MIFIDRIQITYKLGIGIESGRFRRHHFLPALNSRADIFQVEGSKQIEDKTLKSGFDSIVIVDSPVLNDKEVQEHLTKLKQRIIQLSK